MEWKWKFQIETLTFHWSQTAANQKYKQEALLLIDPMENKRNLPRKESKVSWKKLSSYPIS